MRSAQPGSNRPRRLGVAAAALALATALAAVAGPRPLSDEAVEHALEWEILLARAVSVDDLGVSVSGGVATLRGTVDHILARDRAERIAARVKGVTAVENRIVVRPRAVADDELHDDVVAALVVDPATDSYEVEVGVDAGVVTLGGQVDSYAEKALATTVAKGVAGVREVKNRLAISYEQDRPDDELRAEIEQRLRWDVRVDDALIGVSVDDAAVRLRGAVGSELERRIAASLAWVGGVRSVDASGLEVQWWARDAQRLWPASGLHGYYDWDRVRDRLEVGFGPDA